MHSRNVNKYTALLSHQWSKVCSRLE